MATRDAISSVVKTILTGRFDHTIAIDNYGNSNNQYSILASELFKRDSTANC
jgi:hypothetical protein